MRNRALPYLAAAFAVVLTISLILRFKYPPSPYAGDWFRHLSVRRVVNEIRFHFVPPPPIPQPPWAKDPNLLLQHILELHALEWTRRQAQPKLLDPCDVMSYYMQFWHTDAPPTPPDSNRLRYRQKGPEQPREEVDSKPQ